MIPAGSMAKRVEKALDAPEAEDVYSVSSCISKDFADHINFWLHNGSWLFDSPGIIRQLAVENSLPAVLIRAGPAHGG